VEAQDGIIRKRERKRKERGKFKKTRPKAKEVL
jgi:hypothetical protein